MRIMHDRYVEGSLRLACLIDGHSWSFAAPVFAVCLSGPDFCEDNSRVAGALQSKKAQVSAEYSRPSREVHRIHILALAPPIQMEAATCFIIRETKYIASLAVERLHSCLRGNIPGTCRIYDKINSGHGR